MSLGIICGDNMALKLILFCLDSTTGIKGLHLFLNKRFKLILGCILIFLYFLRVHYYLSDKLKGALCLNTISVVYNDSATFKR